MTIGTIPSAIQRHRDVHAIARAAMKDRTATEALDLLVAAYNVAMENGDEDAADRYAEAHEALLYDAGLAI